MSPTLRAWLPDLGVGAAIAFIGIFEASTVLIFEDEHRTPFVLVALAMAGCAALVRRAPALALAGIWVVCLLQVMSTLNASALGGGRSSDVMLVEVLVAALVSFGTARWGSVATLWLSLLSIPTAAIVALLLNPLDVTGRLVSRLASGTVLDSLSTMGLTWQLAAAVIGMALLGLPWLTGLALRLGTRAKESEVSQVAAAQDAATRHTAWRHVWRVAWMLTH